MELAADDLEARAFDAVQNLPAELTALEIGARRRELHHGEGADQIGIRPQLDARDVEVVERPRGMNPVVRVLRHDLASEQVVFFPGVSIGHGSLLLDQARRAASVPARERPAELHRTPDNSLQPRRVVTCRPRVAAMFRRATAPSRLRLAGGATEFRRDSYAAGVGRGRDRPSLSMRVSSVVGASPSNSAAPPAPRMRHPLLCRTLRT